MEPMSLEEIKKHEIAMLEWLDGLCKKNDLTFSLMGGTLLGAVRHKGFIPWDDDIDVVAPREIYDKIIACAKSANHPRYKVSSIETGTLPFPFAKIVDTYTQIDLASRGYKEDKMLWIDIFPVDGIPDSDRKVKSLQKRVRFLQNMLGVATVRFSSVSGWKRRMLYPLAYIPAKIMGPMYWARKMDRFCRKHNTPEGKRFGFLCWMFRAEQWISKEEYYRYSSMMFEGKQYSIMGCWEDMLRKLYGDFYRLPPENERRTHQLVVYEIKPDGNI